MMLLMFQDDVSGVFIVMVQLWKKRLTIMKTMVRNPIMIMPMATSVTVICRNQKLTAMMATNNAIQKN